MPVPLPHVHSKLDIYNSVYYDLQKSQINLQQIQNSLARAVVNGLKYCLYQISTLA